LFLIFEIENLVDLQTGFVQLLFELLHTIHGSEQLDGNMELIDQSVDDLWREWSDIETWRALETARGEVEVAGGEHSWLTSTDFLSVFRTSVALRSLRVLKRSIPEERWSRRVPLTFMAKRVENSVMLSERRDRNCKWTAFNPDILAGQGPKLSAIWSASVLWFPRT
jgi:hypothetical protein